MNSKSKQHIHTTPEGIRADPRMSQAMAHEMADLYDQLTSALCCHAHAFSTYANAVYLTIRSVEETHDIPTGGLVRTVASSLHAWAADAACDELVQEPRITAEGGEA